MSFTLQEVAEHNNLHNLWIIIDNKVYDVTNFAIEHPGGADILAEVAGKDATTDFKEVGHSRAAIKLMQKYYIGIVDESDSSLSQNMIVKYGIIGVCVCLVTAFITRGLVRLWRS